MREKIFRLIEPPEKGGGMSNTYTIVMMVSIVASIIPLFFKENYKVNPPSDFNFAYDIVDAWAKEEPDKRALLWCNDHGEEKTFTFTDISKMSNQVANMFKAKGLKKGDVVMLILRRRWEYWITAGGLLKLGVIIVPFSSL